MIKKFKIIFLTFLFLFFFISNSHAQDSKQEDIKNNKFGVHILFTEELHDAVKLVNSNGGDWGYVTIPIQSGDKNLEKWQKFMDDAKKLHIIPIIRLATEGDYFNTKVWRKPNYSDILDFANFLNSLEWPTKNRYVIIFNEVNRGDEWGGEPNPYEYAEILSYSVTVFKSKSHDFSILLSGFDNASINVPNTYMNEYYFMREMNVQVPGIFYQIDGIASHSYPNPAFAKPASVQDSQSIATFLYEKRLIQEIGGKDLPVFITETGWSTDKVSDSLAAEYYTEAFSGIWNSKDVMAVTPFILRANTKPFSVFSLLTPDGGKTMQYQIIENIKKIKGTPLLTKDVLGEKSIQKTDLPEKTFQLDNSPETFEIPKDSLIKKIAKWLFQL